MIGQPSKIWKSIRRARNWINLLTPSKLNQILELKNLYRMVTWKHEEREKICPWQQSIARASPTHVHVMPTTFSPH